MDPFSGQVLDDIFTREHGWNSPHPTGMEALDAIEELQTHTPFSTVPRYLYSSILERCARFARRWSSPHQGSLRCFLPVIRQRCSSRRIACSRLIRGKRHRRHQSLPKTEQYDDLNYTLSSFPWYKYGRLQTMGETGGRSARAPDCQAVSKGEELKKLAHKCG